MLAACGTPSTYTVTRLPGYNQHRLLVVRLKRGKYLYTVYFGDLLYVPLRALEVFEVEDSGIVFG